MIEKRPFAQRELIVREGMRMRHAYFIENGLTRSYWLVDGQEITTSFSTGGSIVFSMDELYYGEVSQEYVQALEPCEAYAIAIDDLRGLVRSNLRFAAWWTAIHQDEYRRLHRSHKDRLTLPARRRYEEFVRQFPDVARRAPLGCIASYIGVTLPTLSRLRAANLSQDK